MSELTFIPTTWPALLARLDADPNATAQNFMYFFRQYRGLSVSDAQFGPLFFGAVEALARGVVLGQGGQMEQPLKDCEARAQAVAGEVHPALGRLTTTNLAALAVAGMGAVLARPASADLTGLPLERLLAQEPAEDVANRQVVWALLAWGRAAELAPLIRQDPAAAPPDPAARFGASIRNIQTHLARCLLHDAAPLATTAWHAYLTDFPGNLAAEQASWSELLWAARCMHVEVGGGTGDQTLDWLLGQVR